MSDRKHALFPGKLTSLADAAAAIDGLEDLLAALGVAITPGSDLEQGSLAVKYMADYYQKRARGESLPPWPGANLRDDIQVALSIHNLAQLILSRRTNPSFANLIPHLRLLASGAAAQTRPAPVIDQASNKLFELNLALACLGSTNGLEMENPDGPTKERNPDVLARMTDQRLWGFPCKVVHGDHPQSIWDAIDKGVNQIEVSKAETGLVVVSFKNKLPHDSLFPTLGTDRDGDPILGALPSEDLAVAAHARFVDNQIRAMVDFVTREEIEKRLAGSKALPAIAVPVETAVAIRTPLGAIPSLLSYLHVLALERPTETPRFDAAAKQVTADINLGLVAGRVKPI